MDYYLDMYDQRQDDDAEQNPLYGCIELPPFTDDELLDMAIYYAPVIEVMNNECV